MVAVKIGKHKKHHKMHSSMHSAEKYEYDMNEMLEFSEEEPSRENYFNCPCPMSVEADETGHPLTSHETKKFNHAVQSRSDYDQYWLKVYNGHSEKVDYNLP
tara:strand:+ start:724 stop:1029 length:306 start_codon:yes stop_codon:yes gene_type:complete